MSSCPPPGVGAEGAGCERTHLLLSASAALLRQHLLRSVGPQAGHPRRGRGCTASLSHPHHAEGDQGNAETAVVQSTVFFDVSKVTPLLVFAGVLKPTLAFKSLGSLRNKKKSTKKFEMNQKYTLYIVNVVNDYSLVFNEIFTSVYGGPSSVF